MPLTRETILTLGHKLAPAAATFSRLRALLAEPDTELDEIVQLIRLDPALTFHVVILDGAAGAEIYPGEAEWPSVSEWEQKPFGQTSAEVTTVLLEHWRFPAELIESVRGHVDPLAEPDSNVGACVLNLACGVAARF